MVFRSVGVAVVAPISALLGTGVVLMLAAIATSATLTGVLCSSSVRNLRSPAGVTPLRGGAE